MDFFKGIGNFFGGLFGGNKDDEERKRKQQQAQQQAQSKAQPTPMQGNKQNTNNWLDTNPLTTIEIAIINTIVAKAKLYIRFGFFFFFLTSFIFCNALFFKFSSAFISLIASI